MKSAGCSRGSVRWSGPRRGQEGIESVPVHRRRRGRAERNFDGDRAVRVCHANLGGELLDDMPDELFRYGFAPSSTGATHTPEEASPRQFRRPLSSRPAGHAPNPGREWFERDQPFRSGLRLPNALRAAAGGRKSDRRVRAPESTGQQEGKQCPITFALELLAVWCLPECLPLFGGQPVAKPHSELLNALDSPYSGRQVGA